MILKHSSPREAAPSAKGHILYNHELDDGIKKKNMQDQDDLEKRLR